jgi:hypothetical protein
VAVSLLENKMQGTVVDWELVSVSKTAIVEVFTDESYKGKSTSKNVLVEAYNTSSPIVEEEVDENY